MMRLSALLLVLLVPAAAAAQPGTAPAPDLLAKLLRSGQLAAEQGKCETATMIGDKVASLDAGYFAQVYAADPIIATCMDGIDRRPRPPSSVAPGASAPLPAAGPERAVGSTGDEKSETVALGLSLGGTLASYALFWYAIENEDTSNNEGSYQAIATAASLGTFFAPSFGHWYTGKFATRGLGLRAAGAGTALIAMMWAFSECPLFGGECNETAGPKVLAVGAVGLFLAGTIDDIASAPGRVRAYNRKLGGLAIVPVVRGDGASVALTGSF